MARPSIDGRRDAGLLAAWRLTTGDIEAASCKANSHPQAEEAKTQASMKAHDRIFAGADAVGKT